MPSNGVYETLDLTCLESSIRNSGIEVIEILRVCRENTNKPGYGYSFKLWLKSDECKKIISHLKLSAIPTIRTLTHGQNSLHSRQVQWSVHSSRAGDDEARSSGNGGTADGALPTFQQLDRQRPSPGDLTLRRIFPHSTIHVLHWKNGSSKRSLEVALGRWNFAKNVSEEQKEWLKGCPELQMEIGNPS
jgi:hypothetical protein